MAYAYHSVKRLSSGLFQRFLITLAVMALVPSALMGIQMMRISRQGIQDAVLELHTTLAQKTAESVSNYLKNVDSRFRFLLSTMRRKDLVLAAKLDMIRTFVGSQDDIMAISILSPSGNEMVRVDDPKRAAKVEGGDLSQDPGYIHLAHARQRSFWISTKEGEIPRLDVYYPLSEVSDLRVSVDLKSLHESVTASRIGGTGFAMLICNGGVPLIYAPEKLPPAERGSLLEWGIVKTALTAQSVGSSEDMHPDGERVGAYAPTPEISGAVITQQRKDEAYLFASRMRRIAALIMALICVAAVAIAFTLAKRLTTPLLDLTRGAEQVARGEFPEDVRIRTNDELQEFAETFNRMVSRLRSYAEMQVDRLIVEQKKSEAMLFSIGDGVLMTDMDGVVQLSNRTALELLCEQGPIEGKKLEDVLPAQSELKRAVLDAVARPEEKTVKEVDLSTDERRLFVHVSARRVISPSKKTELGVVTVLHDVTLEKELDKMKEEFLHSITHDLRNPLGSIVGFLEFLRKGVVGVLNPQQKGMVESMLKSANRLMTLVNNILDVAKMEASGKLEMTLKESSVAGLASHSLEILEALAQRRGITLELQSPEEFTIPVDANQIERVIANLVGNAIKFAPDDGKVSVRIEDKGGEILVCVEDNGPGIPPTHLTKIFEKFEQVPGQKRGGTGLGLTICKRFVEEHLGRIWVESELGKGARFYFTLPKKLSQDASGNVVSAAGSNKDA